MNLSKYITISIILLVGKNHLAFSQIEHFNTVTQVRTLQIPPILPPPLELPKQITFLKRGLKNSFIENPYIRYTIENLKGNSIIQNSELQQALKILIKYAENDTLRKMADYLQEYIKTGGIRKKALDLVKNEAFKDTTDRKEHTSHPYSSTHYMEAFVSYLEQDHIYKWLTKIGRDSVLLNVSGIGKPVSFWINNDRENYYRFWALNRNKDSIGSWIHVIPGGNNIAIQMDDDVYASRLKNVKTGTNKVIDNKLDNRYFNMKQMGRNDIFRRYWRCYTLFDASLGQGLQANWSGGGEKSLSVLTNLKFIANYNKEKISWENFAHYRLGFLQTGNEDIRKNEDRLELNSKYGYKAFKYWFYTSQLNVQTLLFNSYDYPKDEKKKLISNFMSPAYLNISVGIDYKPNNNFSLYLSPIAGKWTFVRDTTKIDQTRYGVKKEKKMKSDAGARIELRNRMKPFEFMSIKNDFVFFSSYNDSKQNVFIDWKLQFDFKINYYMNTTIYTYIVLDKNYSKKLQFKETLNLGVNFRF